MALNLTGLASGLDTDLIVSQLMQLEQRGLARLELQDVRAQARLDAFKDLGTRLRKLETAATDLRSTLTWADKQELTSSDPEKVGLSSTGGMAPGDHTIEVLGLAVAEQGAYTRNAGVGGDLTIASGTTSFTLTVDAAWTVEEVASQINNASASPVSAVVVEGELVLTSRDSGTDGDFTVTDASGVLTEDPAGYRAAVDASYKIDGVTKTATDNVVTDAIAGVEVTLKAKTTEPITVSVGAPATDAELVTEKVKAFVDTYNETIAWIRARQEEAPVRDPQTTADAKKGPLYGDVMLRGLESRLRQQASATIGTDPGFDQLYDIGVSTGAAATEGFSQDGVEGKLVLDISKLEAALADDPLAVRQLLGGVTGTDGFAQGFEGIIDPVEDEALDGRIATVEAEQNRIDDAVAAMNRRLEQKEARLRAQFAAMETALQSSQAQMAWLGAQISSLPTWGSS